jgi:hypothetical protein
MGRSDSIRSKGASEILLGEECGDLRAGTLKLDGALWVTGTHHIIFSIGFALQRLGYRIINAIL